MDMTGNTISLVPVDSSPWDNDSMAPIQSEKIHQRGMELKFKDVEMKCLNLCTVSSGTLIKVMKSFIL